MLKEKLKLIYNKIFWPYERILEKEVGGYKSLLDLGCGYPSPIKAFSSRLYTVGVDTFGPSIQKSREEKIHNDYYQENILEIDKYIKDNSFDCVVALDLIEHLKKEDGFKLIRLMERLAKKKVIILTPNGFLSQPAHSGNEKQEHLSGWTTIEMKKLGYRVIGVNGWKPLRGEFGYPVIKPKILGLILSDFTQILTRWFPLIAFQILCIKDMEPKSVADSGKS